MKYIKSAINSKLYWTNCSLIVTLIEWTFILAYVTLIIYYSYSLESNLNNGYPY